MSPLDRFADNPEAMEAFRVLEETSGNLFLTGKAGTGKSTFLKDFLRVSKKKCVVVAPTGVAALNAEGQTIHSFFQLEPRGFRPLEPIEMFPTYRGARAPLMERVDIIIIDEISMVRSDLLTAIDMSLKKHMRTALPFGGKQMLFIGDLYQLPPVVNNRDSDSAEIMRMYRSKYFFDAAIDNFDFDTIELKRIYRQAEEERVFIEMLNRIRYGKVTDRLLAFINKRVLEGADELPDKVITISTVNRKVNDINDQQMAKLETEEQSFSGERKGSFKTKYDSELPVPQDLVLKVGARVMLTKNDMDKRWVNGSLGTVVAFEDKGIRVELDSGKTELIPKALWEDNKYEWNREEKRIDKSVVGEYIQFPMKPAWAITIHKSQGLTFDKVMIDLHTGAFDTGQTYVALSRCTTYEGIYLAVPVRASDIMVDRDIVAFTQQVTPDA